jgi:hypothetical protein
VIKEAERRVIQKELER